MQLLLFLQLHQQLLLLMLQQRLLPLLQLSLKLPLQLVQPKCSLVLLLLLLQWVHIFYSSSSRAGESKETGGTPFKSRTPA